MIELRKTTAKRLQTKHPDILKEKWKLRPIHPCHHQPPRNRDSWIKLQGAEYSLHTGSQIC
jgi:hypothetical protein